MGPRSGRTRGLDHPSRNRRDRCPPELLADLRRSQDPRWGRVFETGGESLRLVSEFAAAKVRGYQGDGLEAGESTTVAVEFPAEQFGVYAPGDGHRVESGYYDLHVGDKTITVTVEGDHL